jgi:hypothetical protein
MLAAQSNPRAREQFDDSGWRARREARPTER